MTQPPAGDLNLSPTHEEIQTVTRNPTHPPGRLITRLRQNVASLLVLAAAVLVASTVFGWSPVSFGLTLAATVVVLTGLEATVRRSGRKVSRRGGRR